MTFYEHNIEGCLADKLGEAGLTASELEVEVGRTPDAIATLRKLYDDSGLPLLRLPEATADLAACKDLVNYYLDQETTDIVLFGIGGSSLGAKALAQITGYGTPAFAWPEGQVRVHIFDNLDGLSMDQMLAGLDLRTTRFLVISKSGATPETMVQALSVASLLKSKGAGSHLWKHFGAIAMPGDNPLRKLAQEHDFPVIDHDPAVGGRFSVLSTVGMVPAILMGLDPLALRAGAHSALQPILKSAAPEDIAPALGAAVNTALQKQRNISMQVIMPYADRLQYLAFWHRQLWAESLGKQGKGTTPIDAVGPVDQHSQMQLYLDGPVDKLVSVITTDCAGKGPGVDPEFVANDALSYLGGKTVGDLVDAEQRATVDTLISNGRPTRTFAIDEVREETMGALMMHFMLETIIAAHLWGVEPYEQPAVEEGKVLARQYLGEM